MRRTVVVTGSTSGLGASVSQALTALGDRVIGVDFAHAEVTADLSTVTGRLEGAETTLEVSGGVIHSIVACAEFHAPKPVSVSVNFFGVTQFVEALSDVLKANRPSTVIALADHSTQHLVCENLVAAMLDGDEFKAVLIGQQLADESPEKGGVNVSSSKQALHRWINREKNLKNWAGSGISLHSVDPSRFETSEGNHLLLDYIVSLAHPLHYAV
jgi:NAD(P)-dependent dehydrogenase (short-subunit alcohol dehydrogenase family)